MFRDGAPRRSRALLLAILAVPALAAGAVVLLPGWSLAKARARVEAELVRRETLGFDRAPILDPPAAGDIAEAYEEAGRRLDEAPAPLRTAVQRVQFFPPVVGLPADADLARLEGSLGVVVEAVEEGPRRSSFRFDLDYRPGLSRWKERRLPEILAQALFLETERARARGTGSDALRAWTALLGYSSDRLRGIEAYLALHAQDMPLAAIWLLDRLFVSHAPGAPELREALRALDRVEAEWPGIEEAVRIHFLICRVSVLTGDGASLSAPDPDWRYLWRRDAVDLALLRALQGEERLFTGLFRLPPGKRKAEAERVDTERLEAPGLGGPRNWHGFQAYVDHDLWRRSAFGLMKTALAAAWEEAEAGRPPERLEALVPRRLSALPLCPETGQPYGYSPGRVWGRGYDGKDDGGRPLPDDFSSEDGDLVIRLPRRR